MAGVEYTPTTAQVRSHYVGSVDEYGTRDGYALDLEEAGSAFDRWLAAHDREVAERAWESGLNTGIGFKTAMDILGPDAPEPTNPYREVTS